jgi:hypothetical protein
LSVVDEPFYLTCKPVNKIDSNVWVFPRPMGKNTLGQLMSMAAAESGLERKTNHFVRKSTVKTLRKHGVPAHKIMQVTGHRSLTSIEAYGRELSDDEQIAYSDILTGRKSPPKQKSVRPGNSSTQATVTCANASLPNTSVSTMSTSTPASDVMKSSMSYMFDAGTVMNNCTFNISFNMAEMNTINSPIPAKRRRIISDSD